MKPQLHARTALFMLPLVVCGALGRSVAWAQGTSAPASVAVEAPTDPYPGREWTTRPLPASVDGARLMGAVDRAFAATRADEIGETRALLIVQHGAIVFERYARGFDAQSRLVSYSIAKSFTGAAVGFLVDEGKLKLQDPAPVPLWRSPADARGRITLDHLLTMTSGLAWAEINVGPVRSDASAMLYRQGRGDMARYAADRPLDHTPGEFWNYSTGTTTILADIVARTLAGDAATAEQRRATVHEFFTARLFGPLGIRSAVMEFDSAGTFVAGSALWMTAQDFARFGYLYLRGGEWNGRRLLSSQWLNYTATPGNAKNFTSYGAQFWLIAPRNNPTLGALQLGASSRALRAIGAYGQEMLIVPERSLVIVRLGASVAPLADTVTAWSELLPEIALSFPES